jgi:hypothetical protein
MEQPLQQNQPLVEAAQQAAQAAEEEQTAQSFRRAAQAAVALSMARLAD